ncbi:protein of unknown function [Caballeronia sp. S22]
MTPRGDGSMTECHCPDASIT